MFTQYERCWNKAIPQMAEMPMAGPCSISLQQEERRGVFECFWNTEVSSLYARRTLEWRLWKMHSCTFACRFWCFACIAVQCLIFFAKMFVNKTLSFISNQTVSRLYPGICNFCRQSGHLRLLQPRALIGAGCHLGVRSRSGCGVCHRGVAQVSLFGNCSSRGA